MPSVELSGTVAQGLDYFGARYYSGAQGRLTSPDEPLLDQDPGDPQSWNLYSYVRNNPLRFVDRNGRECVKLDRGGTGDNGVGEACKDKSLSTTHGVTVNGTTGAVTSSVFGNAVVMGDIRLNGSQDRIADQSAEIAANAAPLVKTGLAGLGIAAAVRMGEASLVQRIAAGLGARILGGGAEVTAELASGATVTYGAEVVGRNLTVNISSVVSWGSSGNLFSLRQGLMAVARAEGADSLTIVPSKVGNPALAETLGKAGFEMIGQSTWQGRAVQAFTKTYPVK